MSTGDDVRQGFQCCKITSQQTDYVSGHWRLPSTPVLGAAAKTGGAHGPDIVQFQQRYFLIADQGVKSVFHAGGRAAIWNVWCASFAGLSTNSTGVPDAILHARTKRRASGMLPWIGGLDAGASTLRRLFLYMIDLHARICTRKGPPRDLALSTDALNWVATRTATNGTTPHRCYVP